MGVRDNCAPQWPVTAATTTAVEVEIETVIDGFSSLAPQLLVTIALQIFALYLLLSLHLRLELIRKLL